MVFNWWQRRSKKDEALKIRWHVSEHKGKNRDTIEDSHLVSRADAANGVFYAAVADGMGGHNGGAFASRNAIRYLEDSLTQAIWLGNWFWPSQWGDGCMETPLLEGILKKAIYTTDVRITELSKNTKDMSDMGSTLTAVALAESSLHFVHAGDSRLYHLKDGGLSQVTNDHTFNPAETTIIFPPNVNSLDYNGALIQYLGIKKNRLSPQHGVASLSKGDVFLLCSDGLHSVVSQIQIEKILIESGRRSVEDAAKNLVQAALLAGSSDDITVMVFEAF